MPRPQISLLAGPGARPGGRARVGGPALPRKTLRRCVDLTARNSGQGVASLTSPGSACGALLFRTGLPDRVYGPGRLPAYARFLGGVGRPANLFRLGRLDRCAGSTRKRIEQGGLLSTSGVPSWGANPAPTNRSELRKPEGRYLGQFSHLSVGQTLLASKEDQPERSRGRSASPDAGVLV